jgi:hypothetical protein
MNLLIFLVVWVLVWYIPIPPTRFKLTSKRRIFTLIVGLVLFGFNVLSLTPLSSFVYFLIFSRLFVAIGEYFVSEKILRLNQINVNFQTSRQFPEFRPNIQRRQALIGIVLILVFVLPLVSLSIFGEIQRLSNASYFNGFIQEDTGLPFSSTIPDNMVRLVTKELAISIARRHMSEFGSNTQVLDCHVTKSPGGGLVWIATIASTNTVAENYIKGFVLVDATEPTATPQIIHSEFYVGEGLWWDRNIPLRNYFGDISKTYGVSYPTWDLQTTSLVYVVTRYTPGFDFIKRNDPPLAYDATGNLQYEPSNAASIPVWMTQVYDEDWLENMINEMGSFKRDAGFDYFAGGFLWFVAPSRDRFQMTEDTRYIVDPTTNEVVALICVNPVENQRSLSGVFKATREGIRHYDLKQANYISGMTAEDLVEGRLPKPATGSYQAIMPLLYTVETSAGSFRLAWYVPIYWYEDSYDQDETVYLAGFAVVDAQDTNKIAISINQEGITSEQLVRQTRLQYVGLFTGNVTSNVQITATVLNRYEYVREGSTHIVLRINNESYPWIEATPNDLPSAQWNQLLSTQLGQQIVVQVEIRQDIWTIIDFAKK